MGENEHIKLDATMKSIFNSSSKIVIPFINNCFKTEYVENAEITYGDTEIIRQDFHVRRMDLNFVIKDATYHIEFQMKNVSNMLYRMLEYAFMNTLTRVNQNEGDLISFPKQLIIYMEKDENIQDEFGCLLGINPELNFADVKYGVHVIKYWEYSLQQLVEEKMYVLIPLFIFNKRKEVQKIHKNNIEGLTIANNQIKKDVEEIMNIIGKLYSENKVDDDFLDRGFAVLSYTTGYFYRKYFIEIEEEVDEMVKKYVDEKIKEKAVLESKQDLIIYNLEKKFIVTDDLKTNIKNIWDQKELMKIYDESIEVKRIEDFTKKLNVEISI